MISRFRFPLSLGSALMVAATASAVDGVIEINQARALAGAVTPGDAAGFPVEITTLGSYVLTSTLSVPDSTDGILISASDVAINLNGFAVAGPNVCSSGGSALFCPTGVGRGITAGVGGSGIGIQLRNGRVTGFRAEGIFVFTRAQTSDMIVESNGGDGIATSTQAIIARCHASRNAGVGFTLSDGSLVTDSIADRNLTEGISAGPGSTIARNSARKNGGDRIHGGSGASITGNTATLNELSGIDTNSSSVVSGNSAFNNGGDGIQVNSFVVVSENASGSNGGDGIQAISGSTIQGNAVRSNTGFGLRFTGSQSSYRGNTISSNTAGTVTGGAVNLGANACDGNTTCP